MSVPVPDPPFTSEDVEASKTEIVRVIEKLETEVTFVELLREAPILKGDFPFVYGHLVYWTGMSLACMEAINVLLKAQVISAYKADIMMYRIDGITLDLPVAKRDQDFKYKKDRWFPVWFGKGDAF